MNKDIERRTLPGVELRVEGEVGEKKIRGYAAVFNELSENLGGFRERVEPGTFAETIKTHDIRALINHSPDLVLGRNLAGTLTLKEDSRGLAVVIDPPDTQSARDLVLSIERGDVSGMSFGFRTLDDAWEETDEGDIIHVLKSVRLFDVSPVTFPAYPQTDVAVRSLGAWREQKSEAEKAAALPGILASHRRRRLDLAELS